MAYFHEAVLIAEVIDNLKPKNGNIVFDGTLGGGGHAGAILEKIVPKGKLIGVDLDPKAVKAAKENLIKHQKNFVAVNDNYKNIKKILYDASIDKIDHAVLDLGLSSAQLEDDERGFSFLSRGPLDLRFGHNRDVTAAEIINEYSKDQLTELFKKYGQERLAGPIAKQIVYQRKSKPIVSANELSEIAVEQYRKFYRKSSSTHPATKIFQALRIEVNQEFENIKMGITEIIGELKPGGKLAVITFHSLEDKLVKEIFKQESKDCICPPKMPVCQCTHQKQIRIVTKKPIEPSAEEVNKNPRSRSAKLRICQKI